MASKYIELHGDFIDTNHNNFNLLIVTATAIEKAELHKHLHPIDGYQQIIKIQKDNHTYYLGRFGAYNAVHVATGDMGAINRGSATTTTLAGINTWHPKVVFMPGIAMGIDKDKHQIGDVLIAERVYGYESARVSADQTTPRGKDGPATLALVNIFRATDEWEHIIKVGRKQRIAQKHVGTILSGEKLIDNEIFRSTLWEEKPTAIGAEMEGMGVYAACEEKHVYWILVKGVSDYGDGHKKKDKEINQQQAMQSAVSLGEYAFSSKYAFRDLGLFATELEIPEAANAATALATEMLQVSEDTNSVVHEVKKQLRDLMQISLGIAGKNDQELYLEQLDSIQELKKQNKHWSVIELLQNFKKTNWNKISEEAKYKVLVRLGTIYLELNEIRKASETLGELKNLKVDKDDQFALLAFASAGLRQKEEFLHYFRLAKERTPENINLWVAYINFYAAEKQTEEIINEIPASIKDTSEILFSLSTAYYLHNNPRKGLQCLRQSVETFHGTPQAKADLKFVLGTRLLMPHNFIDKIIYNHYTDQDKAELHEALRLFTDAWDSIKLTELAKTKWHILLNRGVVYKILGDKNAALFDFSSAYELSGNAGAFENLIILLFNVGQFARADDLISKFPVEFATEEEKLNILAFKIRSLHLQDRTKEAVDLLTSTSHQDPKKEQNKYSLIIAMLLEKNEYEQAILYTSSLKEKFPNDPDGYILTGTILIQLKRNDEARQELLHAIPRLNATTPINQKYELASGLIKLENFSEAAEILEQIVDWNIWNDFSKGLIYAWYMSGNIQKALRHAERLYELKPGEPFLAEIILRINDETKALDKAIETGEKFLPNAKEKVKTFFLLHIANLYFKKKDRSNTRKYCNAIENAESLSMDDQFRLAFLIVKTGDPDKGLELAYLARNRFYNTSDAHAKFITVVMQLKGHPNSVFPDIVKNESAVVLQDITGQQTTYIVTANPPTMLNEVSNTDEFAKSMLGKKVGQEVFISKTYSSTKLTIKKSVDKIAFAFRESTDLFYTRFANNRNNIQVFRAIPGHPDDQMEKVIRELSLSRQSYRKQLYALYNAGVLTIGMVAGLLKQNIVFQFLEITTSSDIFLHSYHQDQSRIYEMAIRSNVPIVLDITALLTICMLLPDFNLFGGLKNSLIVAQSVIDELQDFYDEMESAASTGYLSVEYENGAITKYSVSKEEIQKDRTNVLSAITWSKANAQVASPNLIGINRAVRTRSSDMLGEYAYHTLLLAKENAAIALIDDGILGKLLFNEGGIESISIYQLALCIAKKQQISERQFIDLTLRLIKANYIFIPPTEDCLWNSFEAAGFQIRRPFEAAVHGLLVMSAEYCIYHSVKFLKKLFVEAGLSATREQISLYIFQIVARRNDFNHIKERMIAYIQNVFAPLPKANDELVGLLTTIDAG